MNVGYIVEDDKNYVRANKFVRILVFFDFFRLSPLNWGETRRITKSRFTQVVGAKMNSGLSVDLYMSCC